MFRCLNVAAAALTVALSPLAGQRASGVKPSDDPPVPAPVIAAIEQFTTRWRTAWQASEAERHGFVGVSIPRNAERTGPWFRRVNQFCRYVTPSGVARANPTAPDSNVMLSGDRYRMPGASLIPSITSPRHRCPSWVQDPAPAALDDESFLDAPLSATRRPVIAQARRDLLAVLATAAEADPTNAWISGQRLRFALDDAASDSAALDHALDLAKSCRAETWWCASLTGYAQYRAGQLLAAESTFRNVDAVLPAAMRCSWADVSALMDGGGANAAQLGRARAAYSAQSCETRERVAEQLWWLSDPLWSEPGNERYVVHVARKVSLALRASLPRDERFEWTPREGADATTQMILRYGWPSTMTWGGAPTDRQQTLMYRRQTPHPPEGPFSTAEYSAGRTHTVPLWWAIADPLHATASAWDLGSARAWRGLDDLYDVPRWFPTEHIARARPLLQIPHVQTVMLRRDHDIRVAVAADLTQVVLPAVPMTGNAPPRAPTHASARTTPTARTLTMAETTTAHALTGVLLESAAPGTVHTLDTTSAVRDATVVLRGDMPSAPTLLALEAQVRVPLAADLRTRFAVEPPAVLSMMQRTDRAVSDPVLLHAGTDASAPIPIDADAALSQMLGSSTVRAGVRLGVYWETYGYAPTDSVTVSVHVERYTPQGTAQRLGAWLNLAEDLNRPVVIRWTETASAPGRRAVFGTTVPVVGRAITLSTTSLRAGDYLLVIGVVDGKGREVASHRTLTVVP